MRRAWLVLAVILVVLVAAGGSCPPKKPASPPAPDEDAASRARAGDEDEPVAREIASEPFDRDAVERGEVDESASGTAAELNRKGVLETVYFEFDSSELSESSRQTLQRNADWLVANPRWSVAVEGHCDERGTIEYNIALGDRRARTVRDYLASLGVAPDRIRVVSYGEENPVEPGHDESAWAKNRRAEFVIED